MMKKSFYAFLIFAEVLATFPQQAFAAKTIQCANETCSANFGPALQLEKPYYSAIEVGPNNEPITVTVPSNQAPRSVRISVQNGGTPQNLLLNLSSPRSSSNAGSSIVIGDVFASLEMRMDGFNGTRGRDASEICAQRIQAGQYGNDAKTFFNQRRLADPGLNPNRCDRIDLSYMQTYNFTCDDPSYQELAGTSPVVDVRRIRYKARCNGILVQDLCIRRKKVMACNWMHWYWRRVGCGKGCSYNAFTWYPPLNVWVSSIFVEDYLNYHLNVYGARWVCYNMVGQRPGWQHEHYDWSSYYTSPGFTDGASYIPAPGSIWEVYYTQAYGKCDSWWTYVRTQYTNKTGYDEVGNDCNPRNPDNSFAGIPEDPNKIVPWAYTGMAQEPTFGLETLQCAVGECPVNSTLSDLERNMDVITPESGSSGTQQGSGIALIYDAQNILGSAVIGQAGAAGRADLDAPEGTKFCGKIRDANSDGVNSEFARNPSVSFRRYRWKAIRSNPGGNPGVPPAETGNTVEVYKKLDSSVRHMLTKELL